MKLSVNTPEGTRDRLFAECMGRRQVQERLIRLFRQRGYREVSTPETEFYDLFARSAVPSPRNKWYRCSIRAGSSASCGRIPPPPSPGWRPQSFGPAPAPAAVLRPDRVPAGPAHSGGNRELPQCGVELIGAAGMKADLEMVATAVDALRVCGASRFHVELGHAGFFRDVAARMELEEGEMERMRALIEGKNFAALRDMLAPFRENPASAALLRLSRLFGGPEVLDEAEALAGETEAVEYLRALYGELSAAGYGALVRFDLGMVHQIDYYTGVVFRGYVEGAGDAVLSGGRYDSLVGVFGREAQATGFAVDVDAMARTLPEAAPSALDTVVHYAPGYLAKALEAVDSRPAGTL